MGNQIGGHVSSGHSLGYKLAQRCLASRLGHEARPTPRPRRRRQLNGNADLGACSSAGSRQLKHRVGRQASEPERDRHVNRLAAAMVQQAVPLGLPSTTPSCVEDKSTVAGQLLRRRRAPAPRSVQRTCSLFAWQKDWSTDSSVSAGDTSTFVRRPRWSMTTEGIVPSVQNRTRARSPVGGRLHTRRARNVDSPTSMHHEPHKH